MNLMPERFMGRGTFLKESSPILFSIPFGLAHVLRRYVIGVCRSCQVLSIYAMWFLDFDHPVWQDGVCHQEFDTGAVVVVSLLRSRDSSVGPAGHDHPHT